MEPKTGIPGLSHDEVMAAASPIDPCLLEGGPFWCGRSRRGLVGRVDDLPTSCGSKLVNKGTTTRGGFLQSGRQACTAGALLGWLPK